MSFAANFTAIDFETASRHRDSACQLAAVRVREGSIAASEMWMIRPRPLYFSPSNIRIHGITPQDVRDEREFGELWDEVKTFIGDDCIVAHNATFDIGVLRSCLITHRCDIPELQFSCSRAIARATWPQRPRFGLKPLSDWLGIRFQHHDALEDSIACAKVVLAAGIDQQATSFEDLEKKLRLRRGTAGAWGQSGVGKSRRSSRSSSRSFSTADPNGISETKSIYQVDEYRQPQRDLQRLLVRAEFIRPFQGQSIVIVGRLKNLPSDAARELAVRLGAQCQDHLDQSTTILVVEGQSNEAKKASVEAAERCKSGQKIRVLSEAEFIGEITVTN